MIKNRFPFFYSDPDTGGAPPPDGGDPPETPPTPPRSLLDGAAPGKADDDPDAGGAEPWYMALPEELRTEKVQRFDGIDGLVKSYHESQKLIREKALTVPDSKDDAEAWQKFRAAIGVPDSADKYTLPGGEDAEGILDKDSRAAVAAALHGAGVADWQFGEVLSVIEGQISSLADQQTESDQAARESGLNELRESWGAEYDARLARVADAVNSNEEAAAALEQSGALLNPRVVQFIDKLIAGSSRKPPADGGSADTRIDELTRQLNSLHPSRDYGKRRALLAELEAIAPDPTGV